MTSILISRGFTAWKNGRNPCQRMCRWVLQGRLHRLLPNSDRLANGRTGREPGIDYPAGFRVEQPLECPLPSAGNSQGQFPRKMIWRDFMLRSPEATNLQPQPTALKPAPILEVASRTLARPPDKNREQRGQGGPKARKCGGCRSRGKSAKARQHWRGGQT